jgi:hypothetical protein
MTSQLYRDPFSAQNIKIIFKVLFGLLPLNRSSQIHFLSHQRLISYLLSYEHWIWFVLSFHMNTAIVIFYKRWVRVILANMIYFMSTLPKETIHSLRILYCFLVPWNGMVSSFKVVMYTRSYGYFYVLWNVVMQAMTHWIQGKCPWSAMLCLSGVCGIRKRL